MRKTPTAIVVILAAGSLAACKMPWDKSEEPPAPPVATVSDAPAPDTTAAVDPAKPVEQTASVHPAKPSKPEAPQASPAPATK